MFWQYENNEEPGYAILRHDFSPRPALAAYANLVRQLQRAVYVDEIYGLSGKNRGFVFRKDGRTVYVLWNYGDKAQKYILRTYPRIAAVRISWAGRYG